tara:strand:- start:6046 stop:6840 length:795 start_codon:yes stop_codon:yes gene_type:complete
MFYKKKGLPQENEIVVCNIKKISFHSIFATLEEYERLDGMIHISEIAPGRIRNIRDYVKEGKKVVCIVLRVDKVKHHIDLSLRRVSMSLRNRKNEEYKQELKAEKLLENIAFQMKVKLPEVFKEIGFKLIDKYDLLFLGLLDIAANGKKAIADLKINPKYEKVLVELVKERIKPPEFEVHEKVILQSYSSQGIEDIKQVLKATSEFAKKKKIDFSLVYISAPKYRIGIKASDKVTAINQLNETMEVMEKEAKKAKVSIEILQKK